MFERFTEEARQVVVLAQEEARSLRHAYIGTEHLLLGLLRQEQDQRDLAQRPLEALGVSLPDARERIARIVGRGEEPTTGQIPFTPRAKKVLELALREALGLGNNWIGPEHILLGIVREDEGVAMRVLRDLDVESAAIRNQALAALRAAPPQPRQMAIHAQQVPASIERVWFEGLAEVLTTLGEQIRAELGREPDLSDLLLTIACAQGWPPGRALRELGVDLDALWSTLERTRQQLVAEREALSQRIEEARRVKELAIENQEFEHAAQARDEQRELMAQLYPKHAFGQDALREVRRRLGLSDGGG